MVLILTLTLVLILILTFGQVGMGGRAAPLGGVVERCPAPGGVVVLPARPVACRLFWSSAAAF
jgi:hypothetical protein